MARNACSAAARSPESCANCALSSSASGSPGAIRSASSAARLRRRRVAGADRDQPARDREIAAHAAAVAEEHRDQVGRAQDGRARSTRPRRASSTTTRDGDRRHHDRGLDAIALPDDGDVARAVGEPDHAEGQQRRPAQGREGHGSSGQCRCSRCRLQRRDGIGGEPPAGVERLVARLGLGDPGLRPARGRRPAAWRARPARRRRCPARRAARRAPGSRRGRRRAAPRRPGGCGRASRRWPAGGRESRRRARGSPAARSIGRTMAASSWPSAALPGTPEAANGSSAAIALASGASGLTMASSAANGSPRSTALRSADAATASREARSLPAAAARAVVCTSASAAVSLSMPAVDVAERGVGGFGAARQRGDIVGQRLRRALGGVETAEHHRIGDRRARRGLRAFEPGEPRARRRRPPWDRRSAGRGTRAAELVQLLFDRGEPRAQIGRRLAAAGERAAEPQQQHHQQPAGHPGDGGAGVRPGQLLRQEWRTTRRRPGGGSGSARGGSGGGSVAASRRRRLRRSDGGDADASGAADSRWNFGRRQVDHGRRPAPARALEDPEAVFVRHAVILDDSTGLGMTLA